MPIARHDGTLIYYAHVPKCAGSSVEAYLEQRFGALAFVDHRYARQQAGRRWTATSPQHVDVAALSRLFPGNFFDHSFAVVRHPVARIVSAYRFQRDIERTIPQHIGFSDWLSGLPDDLEERPFVHDNHVRPMVSLVPDSATIFHLEHGLEALVPWLDEVCGRSNGPRTIPHVNEARNQKSRAVEPTDTDRALIADIYAADFERFGYRLESRLPAPSGSNAPGGRKDARAGGRFGRLQAGLSRLLRS